MRCEIKKKIYMYFSEIVCHILFFFFYIYLYIYIVVSLYHFVFFLESHNFINGHIYIYIFLMCKSERNHCDFTTVSPLYSFLRSGGFTSLFFFFFFFLY